MAADHHRVERLIAVGFGQANVVFKATGDGAKGIVDDRQSSITFILGVGQHPHRRDVKNFVEGLLLPFHFAMDTVEVLRATAHLHHIHPRCL